MKTAIAFATAVVVSATASYADSRIAALCATGHLDEVTAANDVMSNPDGFYIQSLQTQISHGDPRIIRTNTSGFHVCTASAATPEMDSSKALLLMDERRVTYLFVPVDCPKGTPLS